MLRSILYAGFLISLANPKAHGQPALQYYVINGTVHGVEKGWIYLLHRQTGRVDSAAVQNGIFTLRGKTQTPEFCAFGLSYQKIKDYYFGLFIEAGHFILDASKDHLNDTSIIMKGCATEIRFQQFQRKVGQIGLKYKKDALRDSKLQELSEQYTQKNPDSYVSAFALLSYEKDAVRLRRYYSLMLPAIKKSYFGRLLKSRLSRSPPL